MKASDITVAAYRYFSKHKLVMSLTDISEGAKLDNSLFAIVR